MKIFILNDRSAPHRYFINGLDFEKSVLLKAKEGKVFHFETPEGSIPFVKTWDGYSLVSYIKDQ